jgi:hypothetical protein
MSKAYKIKVNQGAGEAKFVDIPQAGVSGKPLSVKAVPGGKYQLLDGSTGYAPENIRASRSGKDLQVFFEGRAQPDLVIEEYYEVTPEGFNGLIGESESGRFYEYIPETAVGNSAVPLLSDGSTQVGMALGGPEINASGAAVGALVAAAGLNPLLLAPLALLGAAGGGGGSSGTGGNGSGSGTSASGKLEENSSSDSGMLGDGITSVTKPTVVGKADAGASSVEVAFRNPEGKLLGPYKATLNADGTYKVTPTDALIDNSVDTKGTKYTPVITVTNAAGVKTTNDGTPFVVDTQAPQLNLKIDADINDDGYISLKEKGASSDLKVTATFDKSKASVGDEVHFKYSTGDVVKVTLTQAMVDDGKVYHTFKGLIVENADLEVQSWYFDAAKNESTASDSSLVDSIVKASYGNQSESNAPAVLTPNEIVAFKGDQNLKWKVLKVNVGFDVDSTLKTTFVIADASGNMYIPSENKTVSVYYSSINSSNTTAEELSKSQLTLNSEMYSIAETLGGIKSINIADTSKDILNIDLLDVLNHGVNGVLDLNLGAQPQFKIDGNQGDLIRLTNAMQGEGGWTAIGSVGGDYTHYSGFVLGLEVDLLVHKNITVNIM